MKKTLSLLLLLFLLFQGFFLVKTSAKLTARIAMNEDGLAFVSGIESNKILVLSPYGQIINKISLPSNIQTVDYLSSCPCGGYLLLADAQSGRAITLDDRSGKQLLSFSTIANPGSVSVSRHKTRYMAITDTKKNAVLIFTERGSLVREISGGSRFKRADQIILDQENSLWVLDGSSNKIFRFDIQGKLLLTLQASRTNPMKTPIDIDVDNENRLHVLDQSGKILVFSFLGRFLESKDLDKSVKTPIQSFCMDPEEKSYRIVGANSQYFQLESNLIVSASIANLASEKQKKVILLRIGSRIMEHLGIDAVLIDEAPYIDPSSNRSMVPLRAIAEIFGAEVQWNAVKREVSIQWNKTSIRLTINSEIAWIDGVQYRMDTRPAIRKDRTFVPIRFISEAFGAQIQWYPKGQKIVISQ
jgi:hypothetical protein